MGMGLHLGAAMLIIILSALSLWYFQIARPFNLENYVINHGEKVGIITTLEIM